VSCTHILELREGGTTAVRSGLSADDYASEIARLQEIAQNHPAPYERKSAHIHLAHLYLYSKNPNRDYQKALKHLEIYASLEPELAGDPDVESWYAVLKEMERLSKKIEELNDKIQKSQQQILALNKNNRKLVNKNKKYKKTNFKLTEKNQVLEQSNDKLEKTIEMLKKLDQRLEEKRKNFSP
jgi:chromosome segregation ATPase